MKGNIIVILFPFTDLSSIKRRLALVIHETKYDIVVAYISSNVPSIPSTVEKALVIRILGEVDDDLKAEINPKLAACYRL